jgi:hypothetical protein
MEIGFVPPFSSALVTGRRSRMFRSVKENRAGSGRWFGSDQGFSWLRPEKLASFRRKIGMARRGLSEAMRDSPEIGFVQSDLCHPAQPKNWLCPSRKIAPPMPRTPAGHPGFP